MRALKKLRSRLGESFTELLCAVLIMAVAMALLAGMVNAAAGMNLRAQLADEKMYSALTAAENGSGQTVDLADNSVKVTVGAAVTPLSFDVRFYGDRDEMCAYYPESGG